MSTRPSRAPKHIAHYARVAGHRFEGFSLTGQLREFRLTDHGIELTEVYLGPEGVLSASR